MSAELENMARRSGNTAAETATKRILITVLPHEDSLQLANDALRGLLGKSSELVSPDLANEVHEQIVSFFKTSQNAESL